MKKLYNLPILLVTVLFISNQISGQDYDFKTDDLGTVVMEAEHFSDMIQIGDIGSGTESYWHDTATTPEGFSGDGFMKAENPGPAHASIDAAIAGAGYLRYNINFAGGGTYYIWARASHTGGSDDSFHAALADGDNILSKAEFINFQGDLVPTVNTNNWVWIYYSNPITAAATVTVPAPGVFNFRVYIREREFKIDKIILTPNSTYVPDSMSTGPDETLATGLENNVTGSRLLQVYPNPVRSTATVSFFLDRSEFVSIKVYNVLGEEVSTLSNELQKAGKREIRWDATDLSGNRLEGGLYFIKIKAGTETRTIKTMLVR